MADKNSGFAENSVSKLDRAYGGKRGSTISRPCQGSMKEQFFYLELEFLRHDLTRDSRLLAIRSLGGGRRI